MSQRWALTDIGTLMSGDIDAPLLQADTIVVEGGTIVAIGAGADMHADHWLSASGGTVLPGLIDNHVHPVLGDYTPRQSQSGFLEGFVHGGVTSAVSAGEVHLPGRPRSRAGTKALAVLAHQAYLDYRPGGLRMYGGALLLEPGLTVEDFSELAGEGVHLVGEIGISGVQDPETAAVMAGWAKQSGMSVMVHVGGQSVAGSRSIDGEFCVIVQPDVAAHVNGGPTAPALEDVKTIMAETDAGIELVYNGNTRALRDVAIFAAEQRQLSRVVIGTDSPAGAGIAPAGILRVLTSLCSLAGIAPELAVATATGNVSRIRKIPGGLIAVGAPADLVIADAPSGSQATTFASALTAGDTPAVSTVVIAGQIVVDRSRNTAPPQRVPLIPEALRARN